MPNRTTFHKVMLIFLCCFFFVFVLLFFYEDAFHDDKERIVAFADCMLEELKVSLIPEMMENFHEFEKENSPKGHC